MPFKHLEDKKIYDCFRVAMFRALGSNRNKKLERAREREKLSNTYVKKVMGQRLRMPASAIPQPLVDSHREVMRIKREVWRNAKL